MSGITSRENMMRILRHEVPEWVPFAPIIQGFFGTEGVPRELIDNKDYVTIAHMFGGDVLDRAGAPSPVVVRQPNVQVTRESRDGVITVTTETPVGVLVETFLEAGSEQSHTIFRSGHAIKSLADYRTVRFILEDTHFEVSQEAIDRGRARMAQIGEHGIVDTVGPESPFMHMVRVLAGAERLIYDLDDHPSTVRDLLELMAARNCERYELIAAHTPTDIVVSNEDADTRILSPRMFREFITPAVRRYAEICHRHGKIYVDHMCGSIARFLDLIPEMGVDAVDWVAPPPMGDVDFAEARRRWGDAITLIGTVDASVMRFGTLDQIRAHVFDLLRAIGPGDNFILEVPPAAGTPRQNVEVVAEIMNEMRRR
ncbi:MAG: hypothetical protein HYY04_13660 [Chloroflexi bacterium]|nr:hypothetical protein [Chloroflexota bacterium]